MRAVFGRAGLVLALVAALLGFGSSVSPVAADPVDTVVIPFSVTDIEFVDATQRAYVSGHDDDGAVLLVYDTSDWTLLATVPTGGSFGAYLDVVHDGTAVLATVYGTGEVVELSTATNSIVSRVDLSTLLGDARAWDVVEVADDDVIVTSSPGSNGFAYVVRYDRTDPAGTAQRVAGGRIIRAGPRIWADGGSIIAISESFSPNSLYFLDLAQANAPIVAEDSHGSVSGTSRSAIDVGRSQVYTFGGDAVAFADGAATDFGVLGFPILSADGTTLWMYSDAAITELDPDDLSVSNTWLPTCPSVSYDGRDGDITLAADGEHVIVPLVDDSLDRTVLCFEPLDGESPELTAAQNVTAEVNNQWFYVNWEVPSDPPIFLGDEWVVTQWPSGDVMCTVHPVRRWCNFTGLEFGVEYQFVVTPWRDGVAGPSSDPTAPVGMPGALPPTSVVATAGDGRALVEIVEAIPLSVVAHDHVVTASPGGQTCTIAPGVIADPTFCFVEGLTNGVEYTFTVVGRNNGNAGDPSAPSNPVTPFAAPSVPTASVDDDGTVTWTSPSGVVDEIVVRHHETVAPANWLTPLIIDGTDQSIARHPHAVKLFSWNNDTLVGECTGILIHTEWVLTAAHCTEWEDSWGTYDVDDITIVAGVTDWTDFDIDPDGSVYVSNSWERHPGYGPWYHADDVALLRLDRPVSSSIARPIPIHPGDELPDGAPAFAAGWGIDENDLLPDVLQGGTVEVDADCGEWSETVGDLPEHLLVCTTGDPSWTCRGDSGGPLVVNDGGVLFLAGVTSFGSGLGCGASTDFPDAFMRASAYEAWIESHTGPLWEETVLPASATSVDLALPRGRTHVISVEAVNGASGSYSLATVTLNGMPVLDLQEIGVDCSGSVPHPFLDIPSWSFANDSVGCIFELGITQGTSSTTYSPGDRVTRKQMSAFVSRFIESVTGEPCSGSHAFVDVPPSSFAYGPVGCIFELGITTGTSSTTYSPDAFVTREQMASFVARVYRAVTGEPCSIPTGFADVPTTSFAYRDVGCIASLGITQGTSSTTYSPGQFVTRAQMAAFVERLFNAVVD